MLTKDVVNSQKDAKRQQRSARDTVIATQVVVYIDIDDTLVRTYGTKGIPLPSAIEHVRALKEQGALLYCWSSGSAEYAQASAEEVGLADCFIAFLPKPHVLLDDQHITEWRRLLHVHPNNSGAQTVGEYQRR